MIIKIKGGLGNQMFQYAFGRALSLSKKCPLELDTLGYTQKTADTPRVFSLDYFNIQASIANEEKVKKYYSFSYRFLRKLGRFFRPEKLYAFDSRQISGVTCGSYLEGWWQNEQYFSEHAEKIRKELSLKNPLSHTAEEKGKLISSAVLPISLHIRRGDYVSNPHYGQYHGLTSVDYYVKALEIMAVKAGRNFTVFVFTDDIAWAETHMPAITLLNKVIFVSDAHIPDYEEIILMSKCEHHIIANSSFSWWGAWLNPNPKKVVIAPKQWVADQSINEKDATPPEWLRI